MAESPQYSSGQYGSGMTSSEMTGSELSSSSLLSSGLTSSSLVGSGQKLASDELIAQAYASIASRGMTGNPPAPTGSPVAAVAAPPSNAARKTTSSRASSAPSPSSVPSLRQQAQTRPSAGPKTMPAQAPYKQAARDLRQSSPFQPPPPTGSPIPAAGKPIMPSRQAVTTGPGSSQPNTPRPANQRPAQQLPKKKSNWVAWLIWLFIIMFVVFVMPYLRIFD